MNLKATAWRPIEEKDKNPAVKSLYLPVSNQDLDNVGAVGEMNYMSSRMSEREEEITQLNQHITNHGSESYHGSVF